MEVSNGPVVDPTCSFQKTPVTPPTPPLYANRAVANSEKHELKRSSSLNTSIEEGESVGKLAPPKQLGIYLNSAANSWIVSWETNGIYSTRSFPIDNTAPSTAHCDAIRFYSHIVFTSDQHANPKPTITKVMPFDNVNNLTKSNNVVSIPKITKLPHILSAGDVRPITVPITNPQGVSTPYGKPIRQNSDNLSIKPSIYPVMPQTNGIFTRLSTSDCSKQRKHILSNDEFGGEKDLNRARGVYFDKNSQRWFGEHKFRGVKCAQSFSVKKHGYEEAHKLAVEWKQAKERESLLDELGLNRAKGNCQYSNELREYYIKHSKLFPKVRGVWFNSTPHRMGWVGQAYKKCKRIEKIFSVSKHGFERARELAVNFRNSHKPSDKKSKNTADADNGKIDYLTYENSEIYTISPKSHETMNEVDRLETTLQTSPMKYSTSKNSFMRMDSMETHLPESPEDEFDMNTEDIDNLDTWGKFDNLSTGKFHIALKKSGEYFNDITPNKSLNNKAKYQHMLQFFDNFLNDIESILKLQLPFPSLPPLHKCFESLQLHRKKLFNEYSEASLCEYNKLLGHYYDAGYVMPSDLPIPELYALISLITRQKDFEQLNNYEIMPKGYNRELTNQASDNYMQDKRENCDEKYKLNTESIDINADKKKCLDFDNTYVYKTGGDPLELLLNLVRT